MKKMWILIMLAMGSGILSTQAAWIDGFEDPSYPHAPGSWAPLTAPWEDAASQGAYTGYGYNSPSATYGPGANWEWGHAWRPPDNDGVKFHIFGDDTGTNASLRFMVDDYSGSTNVADTRITVSGLSGDTWYDVRATLTPTRDGHYQAVGEYKLSSNENWITIGTLTTYNGFAPNYIGISCLRGGFMDDVGYYPPHGMMIIIK